MSLVIPLRSAHAPAHIDVRGLSKTYLAGRKAAAALDRVDLTIARGEVFGIGGRAGAGKSTLLRTLCRLEEPSSGQVLIDGQHIGALAASDLLKLRRRIGMVFQQPSLQATHSVFDNLAVASHAAGIRRPQIEQRAREVLSLVGLKGAEQVYPSRLSDGQKQRVSIARALMLAPDILLCDDVTAALAPERAAPLLALLAQLNRTLGLTLVLASQDDALLSQVCGRGLLLERGRVVSGLPTGEPQQAALV